ncbi:ParM/StbA family protein [Halalkalibacter flavus]|uniref:ParM/StbA family protein n=1 Tax=Halalkalibacter flavus TaxID=3090668 RepID=UPI002FC728E0
MDNIAAIDLGFGWTKGVKGAATWRQPSVLGEAKPLFEENVKPGDIIYEGEEGRFFVGNLAVRHSDVKYASIKDSKAESWTTNVLLKTALGCLAPREGINLVTGLPIDFYFSQKDALNEMLQQFNCGDYYKIDIAKEVTYTARPTIRASKIVPQPLGSAMDYLLDDSGNFARLDEAKKRILVVDVGYFTLDLLVIDALEINKKSCSPPELGVDTAYRLLQQYLKEKLGKAPARHELDYVVISNEYEGYNVEPLVAKAFRALATQIQNEVESLNMNFNRCLITGGAAPLIAHYLQIGDSYVLPDPQLANVRGYEKIGRRSWNGSR